MPEDQKTAKSEKIDYLTPIKNLMKGEEEGKVKLTGEVGAIINNLILSLDAYSTPLAQAVENMIYEKVEVDTELKERGAIYDVVPIIKRITLYMRFSENYQALKQNEIKALIQTTRDLVRLYLRDTQMYKTQLESAEKRIERLTSQLQEKKEDKKPEANNEELREVHTQL